MRSTVTLIAAATSLLISGQSWAAWTEHPYADLRFAVEFPDEPAVSSGTYHTVLIDSAPVHIYTRKEAEATYVASVVDLQDHAADGGSLLVEAEYNLGFLGDVSADEISRVEPGKDSVFGHFITVDCRDDATSDQLGQVEASRKWLKAVSGLECPNKARLTVNVLFHLGRLYLIQGMNLPNPDGTVASSPFALRFANSVSLFRVDGSRNKFDDNR